MSIIIFYNKENKPVFKVKTDVYQTWDKETKTKQLKPYYKKGIKAVCHCCEEGRELIISSMSNQNKEKSFYLKRKNQTEKHHPSCCFYEHDEKKRKEDDASFLKQPTKKEKKSLSGGSSSYTGQLTIKTTQERFTFEEIIRVLIDESVTFAYFAKKKQGKKATTHDLLSFIPLKTKQYQERSELAYQMMGYAYVSHPNFIKTTESKEMLNQLSKDSNALPFTVGRIEGIKPISKNEDFVLLLVSTNTKTVFNFSMKRSELSPILELKTLQSSNTSEVWVAGLLETHSKNSLVQLTAPVFFTVNKQISPKK